MIAILIQLGPLADLKIQNNSTLEYIICNRKKEINDEISQEEQDTINRKLYENQQRIRNLSKQRQNNVVLDSTSSIQRTIDSTVDSSVSPPSSTLSAAAVALTVSSSSSSTSTSSLAIVPSVIPTTAHVQSIGADVLDTNCTTALSCEAITPIVSGSATAAVTISDSAATSSEGTITKIEEETPSYWNTGGLFKQDKLQDNTGILHDIVIDDSDDELEKELEQDNSPNTRSHTTNNNELTITSKTGVNQQQQKHVQLKQQQKPPVTASTPIRKSWHTSEDTKMRNNMKEHISVINRRMPNAPPGFFYFLCGCFFSFTYALLAGLRFTCRGEIF
jgi:hypothetical protein